MIASFGPLDLISKLQQFGHSRRQFRNRRNARRLRSHATAWVCAALSPHEPSSTLTKRLKDLDKRNNCASDTGKRKNAVLLPVRFLCVQQATQPIASSLNHRLARSGNTITHTTLSPTATIDFEKSHILAMAPALRDGTTMVSPAEHFFISSEALASLSKKPADTGRQ